MICDFCGHPEAKWSYPASDFAMASVNHASTGGWAACESCHALIEDGNREGLARRAAIRFARQHNVPTVNMFPKMRELHAQFFEHRTGPPVPLRNGDPKRDGH